MRASHVPRRRSASAKGGASASRVQGCSASAAQVQRKCSAGTAHCQVPGYAAQAKRKYLALVQSKRSASASQVQRSAQVPRECRGAAQVQRKIAVQTDAWLEMIIDDDDDDEGPTTQLHVRAGVFAKAKTFLSAGVSNGPWPKDGTNVGACGGVYKATSWDLPITNQPFSTWKASGWCDGSDDKATKLAEGVPS